MPRRTHAKSHRCGDCGRKFVTGLAKHRHTRIAHGKAPAPSPVDTPEVPWYLRLT